MTLQVASSGRIGLDCPSTVSSLPSNSFLLNTNAGFVPIVYLGPMMGDPFDAEAGCPLDLANLLDMAAWAFRAWGGFVLYPHASSKMYTSTYSLPMLYKMHQGQLQPSLVSGVSAFELDQQLSSSSSTPVQSNYADATKSKLMAVVMHCKAGGFAALSAIPSSALLPRLTHSPPPLNDNRERARVDAIELIRMQSEYTEHLSDLKRTSGPRHPYFYCKDIAGRQESTFVYARTNSVQVRIIGKRRRLLDRPSKPLL
jgi:hypothetical protein